MLISGESMAQTWMDITSTCISDPNYKRGNYAEWEYSGWSNSTATRAGCQEFWTFYYLDFRRTMTVPAPGRYRVSVQGYYRPGEFGIADRQAHEDGTEDIQCFLFANDDEVPMASVYDAWSETSLGDCWSVTYNDDGQRYRYFYPNSMETGAAMFRMGHYMNTLETNVGDDCQLTVGIRLDWDNFENSNWVLFTGWKIEWQGTEVPVTAITVDPATVTLTPGEEQQLTATVEPANATFRNVGFSSSDKKVVTVDANGLVTAIAEGEADITVRMVNGSSTAETTCHVVVKQTQVTSDALIINEIQVANIDQFIDPSWNFGGWVELYNPTAQSASLAGLVVSDDKGNSMTLDRRFGAVPAGGYKVVWFDHYSAWAPNMVTFKLDSDGGTVKFSKADGTPLASMTYPEAVARTSYARRTDGGKSWSLTDQPTPGTTNKTSAFAIERLEAPECDHAGGMIPDDGVTVRFTVADGATLRYTLDGSTPTLANGETSADGRFNITDNTVLRARAFKEGMLASAVTTRTFYRHDRDYTLPVVAITTDDAGIFGDDYGIFVQGNGNGRPGNGQDAKCNWNMDWDRAANMEYFTPEGTSVFNQEVAIEAAGGWSRAWSPHSMNIKANKIFEGQKRMDYQFFADAPYLRHKGLKLRNGGNDNNCRIKDAAIQQVVRTSGLNIETQGYQPVHVLINGNYYYMLNLREPNNRNYGYAHYGIPSDEQDQWKMSPDSGYVQQVGTKDAWDKLIQTSYQAESPSFYFKVKEMMDMDSYINYMAVELYLGGNDWPRNNIKSFRAWENGKFRFVLFDTDGAFAYTSPFKEFANKQTWTFDALRGAEERYPYGTRLTAEIEFVTLFLNLLKNADFRKQFTDQFCLVAGSVFEPKRCKEIIDEMVEVANRGLKLDWTSANNTANQVKNSLSASRQTTLVNAMRQWEPMKIDVAPITAKLSSDTEGAQLLVNGLPVPTGKFSGRLFPPVTVTAKAPAGYIFRGWASSVSATGKELFAKNAEWRYYDQGSLDVQEWKTAAYDDAAWSTGRAPLGYDTGNAEKAAAYATTLSYGGQSSNKYPTYYFRTHVNLTRTPASADEFVLDWIADDGFVVYVNGEEAGRFLMDNHPNPTYNDFADTYADANPETGTIKLNTSLFHQGDNVIAVELHNNSASSTDIYWDAALQHTYTTASEAAIVSTDADYKLPESGNITLIATYEPISDMAHSDARPVKVNEVSAANTVYVNDYFKQNDWIELYNTTSLDIDVAGMFLSDHAAEPEKFQIPASNGTFSTIVPAHGFLVVWADKLESRSQLHADFKLASEEGEVVLTAADRSWADTLSYCGHDGLQSVGLYPDGGTQAYLMRRPTIGASNMLTLDDKTWKEPHIVDAISRQQEFTIAETDAVYDLNGRQRATKATLGTLPQGVYIINGKKVIK